MIKTYSTKYNVFLILFILLRVTDIYGQVIRIHTDSLPTMHSPAFNPGFFYNNTTSAANNIFNSSGFYCNSLRLTDPEWYIRSSTSFGQVISNIQNLQGLYQFRATFTDKVIIVIGGMPQWLSSSANGSITCGNWHYYQTVKPSSYVVWDSLVKTIATEISTWGIQPHYEIWNEPDLDCYWNGTEDELIELYLHTAQSIKAADPSAKVGGMGVNGWFKGIASPYNSVSGYIPDSIANESSLLASLIDTCATGSIPLDFITFHFFTVYQGLIGNAITYLKNKLSSAGIPNCEIIITEYNSASTYRETALHSPFVLKCYDEFRKHQVVYHDIASLQDFTMNMNNEFFSDYGCITRNGIKKPIFNALHLLNKVRSTGGSLPIVKPNDFFGLASVNFDTLRLLVSNYVPYPLWGGRNELFFGNSPINTIDLWEAGYNSWSQIDSTISGNYTPMGPPEVIQAFINANEYFLWAEANYNTTDTLNLIFTGWNGIRSGNACILDATRNNSVYVYDSLIATGYSNAQAVNYLLGNQQLSFSNIVITDSTWSVILEPNSVLFIEVHDWPVSVDELLVNASKTLGFELYQNYPNPFSEFTRIDFLLPHPKHITLKVFDLLGLEVATLANEQMEAGLNSVVWDASGVKKGIYFYRLNFGKYNLSKMMVLEK